MWGSTIADVDKYIYIIIYINVMCPFIILWLVFTIGSQMVLDESRREWPICTCNVWFALFRLTLYILDIVGPNEAIHRPPYGIPSRCLPLQRRREANGQWAPGICLASRGETSYKSTNAFQRNSISQCQIRLPKNTPIPHNPGCETRI